jgi:hypothetical protein
MPRILAPLAKCSVLAGRQGSAQVEPGPERNKARDLRSAIAGARDRKARFAGLRVTPSDVSTFSQGSQLLIR